MLTPEEKAEAKKGVMATTNGVIVWGSRKDGL